MVVWHHACYSFYGDGLDDSKVGGPRTEAGSCAMVAVDWDVFCGRGYELLEVGWVDWGEEEGKGGEEALSTRVHLTYENGLRIFGPRM
jgi:hypothetical protein